MISMKPLRLLLVFLLFSVGSHTGYASQCDTYSFMQTQGLMAYFYSDGKSFDFTADSDMALDSVQVKAFLAAPETRTISVELQLNGSVIASWTDTIDTTYDTKSFDQTTDQTVTAGDQISLVFSGGTMSSPGGAVQGSAENTLTLCYGSTGQSGQTGLDAPVVTVSQNGLNVAIQWSSVAGADGYTLFYAPYPGADSISQADMGTATSLNLTLFSGSAYYLAVKAYNSGGSGSFSNVAYFILN